MIQQENFFLEPASFSYKKRPSRTAKANESARICRCAAISSRNLAKQRDWRCLFVLGCAPISTWHARLIIFRLHLTSGAAPRSAQHVPNLKSCKSMRTKSLARHFAAFPLSEPRDFHFQLVPLNTLLCRESAYSITEADVCPKIIPHNAIASSVCRKI